MSPLRRRLCLAAVSTSLSLAVAIPVVLHSLEGPERVTTRLVDTREEIREILSRSTAPGNAGSSPSGEYPPPLVLRPLDRETAATFYPLLRTKGTQFDERCFYLPWPYSDHTLAWEEHAEGEIRIRTNDLGMRRDEDVRDDDPALRILVLGDSHTAGLVPNAESFTTRLEERLAAGRAPDSVEALNAAVGGYDLYNELGRLENLAHLEPDIVIVVLYGGNDFYSLVRVQRFMERRGPMRRAPPLSVERKRAWNSLGSARAQETLQIEYFLANPDDIGPAVDTSNALLLRMTQRAQELGARFLAVYLPPPLTAQPEHFRENSETTRFALGASDHDMLISDRIADRVLQFLEGREVPHLDLRPRFRRASEALYWRQDLHLNTAGHRIVAEELAPIIAAMAQSLPRAPADAAGVTPTPASYASVRLPAGRTAERWTTRGEGVEVVRFEDEPAIRFPASRTSAALDVPATSLPAAPPVAIRIGVVCDGSFRLRIRRADFTSSEATGADTQRQVAPLHFELPRDDDADGAPLTIEVLECSTPLLLRSIGVR